MRTGNCFEDAGRRITGFGDTTGETLVHGLPMHSVHGIRYPHGWIEFENGDGHMVWDPCADIEIERGLYYNAGMIEDTVRYTPDEARRMTVETGHWGHWDEMFDDAEAALEELNL